MDMQKNGNGVGRARNAFWDTESSDFAKNNVNRITTWFRIRDRVLRQCVGIVGL